MSNPYTFTADQRFSDTTPTTTARLNRALINADSNNWALKQLLADGGATAGWTYTNPGRLGSHWGWWHEDSTGAHWFLIKFDSTPTTASVNDAKAAADGYFVMSPISDVPDA